MPNGDAINPVTIAWRIDRLERAQDLIASKESVASLRATVNERGRDIEKRIDTKADASAVADVRDDVRLLSEEVRGLRRVIMGFAVAFATGSIGVSLTLIGTYLH